MAKEDKTIDDKHSYFSTNADRLNNWVEIKPGVYEGVNRSSHKVVIKKIKWGENGQ